MAKNAKLLELGPANVYLFVLPKASLTTALTGTNNDLYYEAVLGGVVGNAIAIVYVDPVGNNKPLSVSVAGSVITVSLATGVAGAITTTASDIIAAIQANSAASFLVTVGKKVGDDGTGVVTVLASTLLTGGSDTGVATDVGFVGDGLIYQVTTEAGTLTGAQTGNTPQDKVVIGGMVKVMIPFKEISMDNLRRGVPLARKVQNSDGSKSRVDFGAYVGLSLRSLATRMELRKILGGFESAQPKDIIVIPEISPAEGEVNFPFAPTSQREIATNWYAWPNGTTNRWSFFGDEFV